MNRYDELVTQSAWMVVEAITKGKPLNGVIHGIIAMVRNHDATANPESAVPHMRETELVAMVTALGYNVTKAESAARQEAAPHAWLQPGTGNSAWPDDIARCRVTHPEDYEDWYPVYLHPAHPSPAQSEGASEGGGAEARDAARWRHARQHALGKLLEAYSTPDTCDVGLDYAVDVAIAASTSGEGRRD